MNSELFSSVKGSLKNTVKGNLKNTISGDPIRNTIGSLTSPVNLNLTGLDKATEVLTDNLPVQEESEKHYAVYDITSNEINSLWDLMKLSVVTGRTNVGIGDTLLRDAMAGWFPDSDAAKATVESKQIFETAASNYFTDYYTNNIKTAFFDKSATDTEKSQSKKRLLLNSLGNLGETSSALRGQELATALLPSQLSTAHYDEDTRDDSLLDYIPNVFKRLKNILYIDPETLESHDYNLTLDFSNFGMKEEDKTLGTAILEFAGTMALDIMIDPYNWAKWSAKNNAAKQAKQLFEDASKIDSDANVAVSKTISDQFDAMIAKDDDIVAKRIAKEQSKAMKLNPDISQAELNAIANKVQKAAKAYRTIVKTGENVYKIKNKSRLVKASGKLSKEAYGAFVEVNTRNIASELLGAAPLERKIFGSLELPGILNKLNTLPSLKGAAAKANLIGLSEALVSGNKVKFTDYFIRYLNTLNYSETTVQLILKRLAGQLAITVDNGGKLKYEMADDIAMLIGDTVFDYYSNPSRFTNAEVIGEVIGSVFDQAKKAIDFKRDFNIALSDIKFLEDYNRAVNIVAGMPILTPTAALAKLGFKGANKFWRFIQSNLKNNAKHLTFDIGTALGKEPNYIVRFDDFDSLNQSYMDSTEAMVRAGVPVEIAEEAIKEIPYVQAESVGIFAKELYDAIKGITIENYSEQLNIIKTLIKQYSPRMSEFSDDEIIDKFLEIFPKELADPKNVTIRNAFEKASPTIFMDIQNINIRWGTFKFYISEGIYNLGVIKNINSVKKFIDSEKEIINIQFREYLDTDLKDIAPTIVNSYKGIIKDNEIEFKTILNDLFDSEPNVWFDRLPKNHNNSNKNLLKNVRTYSGYKEFLNYRHFFKVAGVNLTLPEYLEFSNRGVIKNLDSIRKISLLKKIFFRNNRLKDTAIRYFNIYKDNYIRIFNSNAMGQFTEFDSKYLNNFKYLEDTPEDKKFKFTFSESEHDPENLIYYYPKLVDEFIDLLTVFRRNPIPKNFEILCDKYKFVFIECNYYLEQVVENIDLEIHKDIHEAVSHNTFPESFNNAPLVKNINLDNRLSNLNNDLNKYSSFELEKTARKINNFSQETTTIKYTYSNLRTDTKLKVLPDYDLETIKISIKDALIILKDAVNLIAHLKNDGTKYELEIPKKLETIGDVQAYIKFLSNRLVKADAELSEYRDNNISVTLSEGVYGEKIFDKSTIQPSNKINEKALKIITKYKIKHSETFNYSFNRIQELLGYIAEYNFTHKIKSMKKSVLELKRFAGGDLSDLTIDFLGMYRYLLRNDSLKHNLPLKNILLKELKDAFPKLEIDNVVLSRSGIQQDIFDLTTDNAPRIKSEKDSIIDINNSSRDIERLNNTLKSVTDAINSLNNLSNCFKLINTKGQALVAVSLHNASLTQYMLNSPEVNDIVKMFLDPNSECNKIIKIFNKEIDPNNYSSDTPIYDIWYDIKMLIAQSTTFEKRKEIEKEILDLGNADVIEAVERTIENFRYSTSLNREQLYKYFIKKVSDELVLMHQGHSSSLDFIRSKAGRNKEYLDELYTKAKKELPWITRDDVLTMLDTGHGAASDVKFMFIAMMTECPNFVKPYIDGTLGTTMGLDLEFEYADGHPTTNTNIALPTEIGFAFINQKEIGKDLSEGFNYVLKIDKDYSKNLVKYLRNFDLLLKLNNVKNIATYNGTKVDFRILERVWRQYDKKGFYKSYFYKNIIEKENVYTYKGEHTVDFLPAMMNKNGVTQLTEDHKIKIMTILDHLFSVPKLVDPNSIPYNFDVFTLRAAHIFYTLGRIINNIDKSFDYPEIKNDFETQQFFNRLSDILRDKKDMLSKVVREVNQFNNKVIIQDVSKIKYTFNDVKTIYINVHRIEDPSIVTDNDLYYFIKDFLHIEELSKSQFEDYKIVSNDPGFGDRAFFGLRFFHGCIIQNVQLYHVFEKILEPKELLNLSYNDLKIKFHEYLISKDSYKLGNLKKLFDLSPDTQYMNLWNSDMLPYFKPNSYTPYELRIIKSIFNGILEVLDDIKIIDVLPTKAKSYSKIIKLKNKIKDYFPAIVNVKNDLKNTRLHLYAVSEALDRFDASFTDTERSYDAVKLRDKVMHYHNVESKYKQRTIDPNKETELEQLEKRYSADDDSYHLTMSNYSLISFIDDNIIHFSELVESEAFKTMDNINKAEAVHRLIERRVPGASASKTFKALILNDLLDVLTHYTNLNIIEKEKFISNIESSIKDVNNKNIILLLQSYASSPSRLISDIIFMEPYEGISFRTNVMKYADPSGLYEEYNSLLLKLYNQRETFEALGVNVIFELDTITFKLNYNKYKLQVNSEKAVFANMIYTKNNELTFANLNFSNIDPILNEKLIKTYNNLLRYTGEMYTGMERNKDSFIKQYDTLTSIEKMNAPSIATLSNSEYFSDMHFRYNNLSISDCWRYRNNYGINFAQFLKSARHMINSMDNQDVAIYMLSHSDDVFDINNSLVFKNMTDKEIIEYINDNGYITILIAPVTSKISFYNYKVTKISYMTESALQYARANNAKVLPNHYASFLYNQAKLNPNYNKEDLTTPVNCLLKAKEFIIFNNWVFKVTALNPVSWVNNLFDTVMKSAYATKHPVLYLSNLVNGVIKMKAYRDDVEMLLDGINISTFTDLTDTAIYKLHKIKEDSGKKFKLPLDEFLEIRAIYLNNPGLSSGMFETIKKQKQDSINPKKFNNPIDKHGFDKAYSILGTPVSIWLSPMSFIETASRFAQTNTDVQLGQSHTYSYTSVSNTNFDYDFKDDFTSFAEYFIPFFNFKFLNIKYWIIKLLKDPDILDFFIKSYNNKLMSYRQFTEDEINNNLSLMYNMSKGRLRYGPKDNFDAIATPTSSALDAFEFLTDGLSSAIDSTYSIIQNTLDYVSERNKDKETKEKLEDGTYIITFGKYKGNTMNEVIAKDLPYVETIINQDWMIENKAELRNAFITRLDGYQYVVPFGEKFIGKPIDTLLEKDNRGYAQFILMQPWCQEVFPDVYNYLMAHEIYKDPVMPIGKYKNQLISEIPDSYKAYMLQQDWFWEDYAYVADLFMANRNTLMPEHMIKDIGYYSNATLIGNLNNAANMITTEDEKNSFLKELTGLIPPYFMTLFNTYAWWNKDSSISRNLAEKNKRGETWVDPTVFLPRFFTTIKTYEKYKVEDQYISEYEPEYTKEQFLNSDLYKNNVRHNNYYRKTYSTRFMNAYRKRRRKSLDVAQLHLNIAQLHLI